MSWNVPKNLQDLSAKALVRVAVKNVERRVRIAIDMMPVDVMKRKVNAALSRPSWEDVYTNPACRLQEDLAEDMEMKSLAIIKTTMDGMREWWSSIPHSLSGPRLRLENAFDNYTELNPRYDNVFHKHMSCLLVKLITLRSVFIDRDYDDKDKRCVIPFVWEEWVTHLLQVLGPFNNILELKVYGGMYPSILSCIIKECQNLKSLHISHLNMTDELLLDISKYSTGLEKFYLVANFPWQLISMESFCTAFFADISNHMILVGPEKMEIKFKSLKHIELSYGSIEVAKEFHRLLLTHYTNLETYSCEWKYNIFDDGYGQHGHDVTVPVTQKLEKQLALTQIFLECGEIYKMGIDKMLKLAWTCPGIKSLTLECGNIENPRTCEAESRHLLELVMEWPKLEELHINVNASPKLTCSYIKPVLSTKGTLIKRLTLESSGTRTIMDIETLILFLELCPNIEILKLFLWNSSMLTIPSHMRNFKLPKCMNLKQLNYQETGHADFGPRQEDRLNAANWISLLEGLLKVSPNLSILSISIGNEMPIILEELVSDIETLHLHVKSYFTWDPPIEKIHGFVSHFPNLQNLYLEEFLGKTYFKLRSLYKNTELKLHWGNLHGWPRT